MSTVGPSAVQSLASRLRDRGVAYIDAPVSGSVGFAASGSLTTMVGGSASDVERIRPVLEAIASRILLCGPTGAGAALKLAVNLIVHSLNAAVAEALVLAERAGVPRRLPFELFANSAAAPPFVQYKRAAFEEPESAAVAFSLDLVAKDLRLITVFARQLRSSSDVADAVEALVRRACDSA